MKSPPYKHVKELRERFPARAAAIRTRLDEFAAITSDEYFYELVYCLLTPQSSAVNAGKTVEALKKADLLHQKIDPTPLLRNGSSYIRFHNTKARNLLEAREKIGDLLKQLSNGATSEESREWLAGNIRGLGMKEASHFLRNIGHRDLAILDRHILKNLLRHGVIGRLPQTLTKKRYLVIEKKFRRFALAIHLTMDELDLFFWSSETGEILK
jgi:N-glycosylase/DNA lyase